jgi:ubiquinone/menaquinone biosynthesis C-methylase UbiE
MARTEPFDLYLDAYEEWFEKHVWVYRCEVEAIRHFLPAEGRGVEIGIGTGKFALPFGIGEGIEPSSRMREVAIRRGLRVNDAVAERLPYRGQLFDFALMVTTICFVDDVEKSFHEIRRILKPSGVFVVGMVDKNSSLGGMYQSVKNVNKFYRVATFYSTDEVIMLMKKTGYEDIEVVQTVFGDPRSIRELQSIKPGYGEGGFAVIRGIAPVRHGSDYETPTHP